jgi:hypothetical protein
MADGRWWRVFGVALVPVAVAGLAGCSGGGGSSTVSSPATGGPAASGPAVSGPAVGNSAAAAAAGLFSESRLRGALLTRVNGVAAIAPASTGEYAALSAASTGRPVANVVQRSLSGCAGAAPAGFGWAILAQAPAAAVTFRVGGNAVSEVLIASSAGSASAVLAGRVPAGCAKYQVKVAGKTVKYRLTDKAVTGIGQQARVLNILASGSASVNQWSLVYQGAGFVGTVTVIGPNASEAAVRELARQAYAFAAKSLA